MRSLLLLFVAVVATAQAVSFFELVKEEWTTFKAEHNKNYNSDIEEKFRMKIYMDNKHKIAKHNGNYEMKKVSYKMKMNKYGDMLHHEFVNAVNGFNKSINARLRSQRQPVGAAYVEPANVKIPDAVDWRDQGAVTEVKDQGHCGSCWAFSTTGSLEGQHFRRTGVLVSLSEQNLIDCSGKYGNLGCRGGWMDRAFQYVKDNGGIDTEIAYPYKAEDGKCRYNVSNVGASDVGFVDIPKGDEEKLKSAVATIGPISVAIDALSPNFIFYANGIYDNPHCSSVELNHAVLVVGYGIENEQDYWLVKNSWGAGWGDNGYMKMSRNKNNQCGIASFASYPLI